MTQTIHCRATIASRCLDGHRADPESPPNGDGTFDGKTIVCDSCYVALMPYTPSGQALLHELPAAIRNYRG